MEADIHKIAKCLEVLVYPVCIVGFWGYVALMKYLFWSK